MDAPQSSQLDPVLENSPLGTEQVSVQEVNLNDIKEKGREVQYCLLGLYTSTFNCNFSSFQTTKSYFFVPSKGRYPKSPSHMYSGVEEAKSSNHFHTEGIFLEQKL